jgi:hypothetical protein
MGAGNPRNPEEDRHAAGIRSHTHARQADTLTPDGTMEVTRERVAAAWEAAGMRIYQDRFMDALGHLGITIV